MLAVRRLAEREFFKDLEFHMYGDGGDYDRLVAPVLEFDNVKLHRHFTDNAKLPELLDDFGIGLSSLSLLKDIPWKTIKIDKSFVPEDKDENDTAKTTMFRAVISMVRKLGFNCIAEGVENDYQINALREAGCDYVQGFYYDKPLPKEEFEARLVTKQYDKFLGT